MADMVSVTKCGSGNLLQFAMKDGPLSSMISLVTSQTGDEKFPQVLGGRLAGSIVDLRTGI